MEEKLRRTEVQTDDGKYRQVFSVDSKLIIEVPTPKRWDELTPMQKEFAELIAKRAQP